MKSLLLLLSLFACLACNDKTPYKPQKPFIIYSKTVYRINATYDYFDANGKTYFFTDDKNKYSVGDTLK